MGFNSGFKGLTPVSVVNTFYEYRRHCVAILSHCSYSTQKNVVLVSFHLYLQPKTFFCDLCEQRHWRDRVRNGPSELDFWPACCYVCLVETQRTKPCRNQPPIQQALQRFLSAYEYTYLPPCSVEVAARDFRFPKTPRVALGSTLSLDTRGSSQGVKRPRCVADLSPPSYVEVKIA